MDKPLTEIEQLILELSKSERKVLYQKLACQFQDEKQDTTRRQNRTPTRATPGEKDELEEAGDGKQVEQLEPGMIIGPFRIENRIGKGGMGSVYLACRTDNLDLKVALKVLAYQSGSSKLFYDECKILSGLKHGGIAHLIDAGTSRTGQPWMAMEYVSGRTLKEYVDLQKPNLETRLKIFLQVCDALTHAHQQMIIHRDLKPSNIMVTPDGSAKLLDFGIASSIDPATGQQATVTLLSERIMTPEYASPEQINGGRMCAASDVYSLGVILYELLTGTRPYIFKSHGTMELLNTVNNSSIVRPSMMPDSSGKSVNPFAKNLRGDLDTITLKALERDTNRRYPSVMDLATDLRLYLAGLPIMARPATLGYRMSKLVRRHPWPLALGFACSLFLIFFSVYASYQKRLIAKERDQARKEQQHAQSITSFMVGMFKQVDPDMAKDGEVTAVEILDAGRSAINDNLKEQDDVKAHLMMTMGQVYLSLGKHDSSLDLVQQAVQSKRDLGISNVGSELILADILQKQHRLAEAQQVLDHIETMPVLADGDEARIYYAKGKQAFLKGEIAKADQDYQQALSMGNLTREERFSLLGDQAELFREWGKIQKAIETLKTLLENQEAIYGPIHSHVAKTRISLAKALHRSYALDEASKQCDDVENIFNQLYQPGHPEFIKLLEIKAYSKALMNDLDEAEKLYRKAQEISRNTLGEQHPLYGRMTQSLGVLLRSRTDRIEEAEALLRESLAVNKASLGPDHQFTAISMVELARVFVTRKQLDIAEPMIREAMSILKLRLGEQHPHYATNMFELADLVNNLGQLEDAEKYYRHVHDVYLASFGKDHPFLNHLMIALARNLVSQRKHGEAARSLQEAVTFAKQSFGPNHSQLGHTYYRLAKALAGQHKNEAAAQNFREALKIYASNYGETHRYYLIVSNDLALALANHGSLKEAEELYRKAIAVERAKGALKSSNIARTLRNLALVLMDTGDFDEAEALLREALEVEAGAGGEQSLDTAVNLYCLADLYRLQAQPDKAKPLIEKSRTLLKALNNLPPFRPAVAESIHGAILVSLGETERGTAMLKLAHARLIASEGDDAQVTRRALKRLNKSTEQGL